MHGIKQTKTLLAITLLIGLLLSIKIFKSVADINDIDNGVLISGMSFGKEIELKGYTSYSIMSGNNVTFINRYGENIASFQKLANCPFIYHFKTANKGIKYFITEGQKSAYAAEDISNCNVHYISLLEEHFATQRRIEEAYRI